MERISLLFTLIFVVLCTSIYAKYERAPYDTDGFKTSNFSWNYNYYYGDQYNDNQTDVLNRPLDFILYQDLVLVLEDSNDELKQFKKGIINTTTLFLDLSYGGGYSLEQVGADVAIGSRIHLDVYYNTPIRLDLSPNSTFGDIHGLCFDSKTNTMYQSNIDQSRVLALNLTNNKVFRVYGKPNITDVVKEVNKTSSNFGQPYHLRLDCHGALWVADKQFGRILRFARNQTVPNLEWVIPPAASNVTSATVDIVFDNTCSVAFVADEKRVYRFKAPFVSLQSPDGLLGSVNITAPGQFGTIYRLQLEDYGNGTGLLYILDYSVNRIIVGLTNWTFSQSRAFLACSTSSAVGVCVMHQGFEMQGESATMPTNYTMFMADSLMMSGTSQMKMAATQQMQTAGDIFLAGQLIVTMTSEISDELDNNESVLLMLFIANGTRTGQFDGVTIEGGRATECGVRVEERYTERSMAVLITRITGCGDSEGQKTLSGGAIAGIVIGVFAGVALVLALVVGLAILTMRCAKKKGTGTIGL